MNSEQKHRDNEIRELQKALSYRRKFYFQKRHKTLKTWATEIDGIKFDERGRFITCYNVDKCFMQVTRPHKNIFTSTMYQCAATSQHHVTRVEHSPHEKFQVKFNLVQLVLDSYSDGEKIA